MATGTVVEVVMPQMGVSVSEGTITRWLRNVGDAVQADEPLLEISTDKVDTEVPSPGSGVLQEILVQEGETVPVGTLVARIGAGEVSHDSAPAPPVPPPLPVEPEPAPPEPEPAARCLRARAGRAGRAPAPAGNGASVGERHGFVSPVVARIAAEHGIDPSTIPGTGRDGRVTKKDILAVRGDARERQEPAATCTAAPPRTSAPPRPRRATCPTPHRHPASAAGARGRRSSR